MQNNAAKIRCSNPNCQAENSFKSKLCHKCRTPIVKRYLWALGDGIYTYEIGELINDRYLLKQERVVLDTQPAQPPEIPDEIPRNILPYLKLFNNRLNIPQIYSYIPASEEQSKEIWFLEYGTVPTDRSGEPKYSEELLPKLSDVWQEASALRQLNWLWQIARIWNPLFDKGAVSSLLKPELLRVNGPIFQLQQLHLDGLNSFDLKQLAEVWSDLAVNASHSISDFLKQLCQELETEKITRPEKVIAILDEAMSRCGKNFSRKYEFYTLTDSGPTRKHNEDACYPNTGELVKSNSDDKNLAIVCDGIGGNADGEIASELAIYSILENIEQQNFDKDRVNPSTIISQLNKFTCAANDAISARNDSEKRQERQRMGTTIVMTLARDHQMYLTHVGDSRIYWITATGCHQVTIDDDLASREVQLGYALYRDAIQYPNGGALVQALGMESSVNLRPTIDRSILDEDSIFLLCSDGLSDFDRIDQYWQKEILPVIEGEKNVATATKRLLEIANRQNGHDNVTVALVHCKVKPNKDAENTSVSFSNIKSSLPPLIDMSDIEISDTESVEEPGKKEKQPFKLSLKLWIFIVLTASLAVGLGLFLYDNPGEKVKKIRKALEAWQTSISSNSESIPSSDGPPEVSKNEDLSFPNQSPEVISESDDVTFPNQSPEAISKYDDVTLPNQSPEVNTNTDRKQIRIKQVRQKLDLWSTSSEEVSQPDRDFVVIPAESVIQILPEQSSRDWLSVEICYLPDNYRDFVDSEAQEKLLQHKKKLWIKAEELTKLIDVHQTKIASVSNHLRDNCPSSIVSEPPKSLPKQKN